VTRKQVLIGLSAISLIALAVIAYLLLFPSSAGDTLSAENKTTVTLTEFDRTMGNRNAPVTVLEYAAPTCPHCAHFNMEVFPKLKQEYIDTGKVFYVFRVFPLNSVDLAAEALARCLPADNYFQFIDLLFRNQEKWDPEYGVQDVHGGLVAMGRIAGMNAEQVDTCMANKTELARASQVGADGQAKYNITGTPTFVIDGVVHNGGYAWEGLKAAIDAKLAAHAANKS
jgi:protein-disulfide isomerase